MEHFTATLQLLPKTLRRSWNKFIENKMSDFKLSFDDLPQKGNVEDGTQRLANYKLIRSNKKAAEYVKFLNTEQRTVRCPMGCCEFIDRCNWLPAHFYLNHVDASFPLVGNTFRLRGIRSDWLTNAPVLHYDWFISPMLAVVPNLGLCIATCRNHKQGCQHQMVHVPRNPIIENLAPPGGDGLAPAIVHSKELREGRHGTFSHSWKLLRSTGGSTGLSSFNISSKPRFDQYLPDLAFKADSLAINYRSDVRDHVNSKIANGDLSFEVANSFASVPLPKTDLINKARETATFIKKSSALLYRDIKLKSNISSNEKFSQRLTGARSVSEVLLYAHQNDSYGARPFYAGMRKTKLDVFDDFIHQFLPCLSISPSLWNAFFQCVITHPTKRTLFEKIVEITLHIGTRSQRGLKYSFDSFGKKMQKTIRNCNSFEDLFVDNKMDDFVFIKTGSRDVAKVFDHLCQTKKVVMLSCSLEAATARFAPHTPLTLTKGGQRFVLVAIGKTISSKIPSTWLLRHEGNFDGWWSLTSKGKCSKVSHELFHQVFTQNFNRGWNICLYVDSDQNELNQKIKYLEQMGSLSNFNCEVHKKPLLVLPKSIAHSLTCCNPSDKPNRYCKRKSHWLCPEPNCTVGLCQSCSKNRTKVPVFFGPKPVQSSKIISNLDENEKDDNINTLIDPIIDDENLLPFIGYTHDQDHNESVPPLFTSMGDTPMYFEKNAPVSVPAQVLLNGEMRLLRRKDKPVKTGLVGDRFLQSIVANSQSNRSIPLLYPEALCFTTVFWEMLLDGSLIGSLPTPFWSTLMKTSALGLAPMTDHFKTRVMDTTLPTASDQKYHAFCFDAIVNSELTFSTARKVLARGFEDIMGETTQMEVAEPTLPLDVCDSRRHVNELSSKLAQKSATYFCTLTCNMTEHPGVGILYNAFLRKHQNSSTEVRQAAENLLVTDMVLCWERALEFVNDWIDQSEEQPLGPIDDSWGRVEFQQEVANLPHGHFLKWSGNSLPKEHESHLGKIVCDSEHMFEDVDAFYKMGLLKSFEEEQELRELYEKLQVHICKKGPGARCQRIDHEGKTSCRVQYYPPSLQSHFEEHQAPHSEEAYKLLEKLNLAYKNQFGGTTDAFELRAGEELRAGKYMYASNGRQKYIPTNSKIFAFTRSNCNVLLVDEFFQARYLAEYSAKVDSHFQVQLKVSHEKNESTVVLKPEPKKNQKKTTPHSKQVVGQYLCQTEISWKILGLPYVFSETDFIHIPTTPSELRTAMVKRKFNKAKPNAKAEVPPVVKKRLELSLPHWRCFDKLEIETIRQHNLSSLSPDKITIFSVRPPELVLFDSPLVYFQLFIRLGKVNTKDLGNLLRKNRWVDGFGFEVRLRIKYLKKFVEHLDLKIKSKQNQYNYPLNEIVNLRNLFTGSQGDNICTTQKGHKTVVICHSQVRPTVPHRFLVHLILSQGSFKSELGIFSHGTIQEIFRNANLCKNFSENELHRLLRDYVLTQLRWMPCSTRTFDKFLLSAANTLTSVFEDKEDFKFTAILPEQKKAEANDALTAAMAKYKLAFVDSHSQRFPNLFERDPMCEATIEKPFQWLPKLEQLNSQSDLSFQEQKLALCFGLERLAKFIANGNRNQSLCPLIVGAPGSGKTYLATCIALRARSQGLQVLCTSLIAERAASLGGDHLHHLFKFPVQQSGQNTTYMTEDAIAALCRNPLQAAILKNMDVIINDEIGFESEELLNSIDTILQNVCNCPLPFGGKLMISTGDHCQLNPPQGKPIWMSQSMITMFKVVRLSHFVRSREDTLLQEVISLLRKPTLTPEEKQRVIEILKNNCQFSENWDCVPRGIIKVFGKRKAVADAATDFIHTKVSEFQRKGELSKVVKQLAKDEICNVGSNAWQKAPDLTSKRLSKVVNEPYELVLFPHLLLRLTRNDTEKGAFFQGQLAQLSTLPISEGAPLTVFVAPPGVRKVPEDEKDLRKKGWNVVSISPMTTPPIPFYGNFATRNQYPLKYAISTTVHKVMGETILGIATTVSTSDSKFALWEKGQLLVILSRTPTLKDMYFVGNKLETLATFALLLDKKTQYEEYVHNKIINLSNWFTKQLCEQNALETAVTLEEFTNPEPFASKTLPDFHDGGCVYMLVSTKDVSSTYIGETVNLVNRLDQHNRGEGAIATKTLTLRPWTVFAVTSGFSEYPDPKNTRKQFESTWHASLSDFEKRYAQEPTVSEVFHLGKSLVGSWNNKNDFDKWLILHQLLSFDQLAKVTLLNPTKTVSSPKSPVKSPAPKSSVQTLTTLKTATQSKPPTMTRTQPPNLSSIITSPIQQTTGKRSFQTIQPTLESGRIVDVNPLVRAKLPPGAKVLDVKGDGNCFFRAVARSLRLPEPTHVELRQHTMEEVAKYLQSLSENDWQGLYGTLASTEPALLRKFGVVIPSEMDFLNFYKSFAHLDENKIPRELSTMRKTISENPNSWKKIYKDKAIESATSGSGQLINAFGALTPSKTDYLAFKSQSGTWAGYLESEHLSLHLGRRLNTVMITSGQVVQSNITAKEDVFIIYNEIDHYLAVEYP
jgi:hypothetical protein